MSLQNLGGEPRPRFLKIPAARRYGGGLSRGTLYKLAAKHPGLFKKYGKATLVDLEIFDSILNTLPAARLGARAA
jgi:hypothetical protein